MTESMAVDVILITQIAIFILQTPILVLYWHRRNLSPIKERFPIRSLLAVITISIDFCGQAYSSIRSDYNCYLLFSIESFASSLNYVAMLTRFLGYYLVYRLNRAKVLMTATGSLQLSSLGTNLPTPTKFDRWILKHPWMVTWKLSGPIWGMNILTIAIFTGVSYPYLSGDVCDYSPAMEGFLQVWAAVWVVLFIIIGINLRHYVDGFHIQWELVTIMKVAVLVMILWLIPAINDFSEFPIVTVSYWVLIETEWIVTIALPIKWSYGEFAQQSSSASVKISLEQILQRTDAVDAFMQFLAREFCIESLYFLLAVKRLKDKAKRKTAFVQPDKATTIPVGEKSMSSFLTDNGLQASLNDIYETFCKQGSPLMINISSALLTNIEMNLDGADVTVYDEAVREIERLLEQNCLQRFLQSDLGRPLNTIFQ